MYWLKNSIFLFSLFFWGCGPQDESYSLLEYSYDTNGFVKFTKDTELFKRDGIVLFCFFSAQCPMSIKQIPRLRNLKNKYSDEVQIYIVIPGIDNEEVKSLRKVSLSDFDVLFDTEMKLVKKLDAEVTPHYFIFQRGIKVYSGPLDNGYKSINVPSNQNEYINYLEDVILKIKGGGRVDYKYIEPIGCYI